MIKQYRIDGQIVLADLDNVKAYAVFDGSWLKLSNDIDQVAEEIGPLLYPILAESKVCDLTSHTHLLSVNSKLFEPLGIECTISSLGRSFETRELKIRGINNIINYIKNHNVDYRISR